MASMLAAGTLTSLPASASADTANAPSLVISQFKITSSNGQFFTLYNATGTALDMSKYELEYFNSYDLTKATSSKLITLTGTLPPHGYYMVNDSSLMLCYQLTIDSVSLGLSSTAGMVELIANNQAGSGSSVSPVLQDYVGWSKTAASGAQTLPSNTNAWLQRLPVNTGSNPDIATPGSGTWQTVQSSSSSPCSLVNSAGSPVASGQSQLLPGVEPAATIISTLDGATNGILPDSDIGLMSPLITEILPNPAGSGNDDTAEFIELYNPNPVDFDLSGFSLQVGTTTLHTYIFPAGIILPASGFVSYYANTTKLTLTNSGGQVGLLDPSGNSVYSSAVYGEAADGQAWALANGKWYWTSQLTPGAANVIVVPVKKPTSEKSKTKISGKLKSAGKSNGKTKAAKAAKPKKQAKQKIKATLASSSSDGPSTPIHSSILALIGGLALLYGAYEYRADIGNKLYQLKRYFRNRRADRMSVEGRGSD